MELIDAAYCCWMNHYSLTMKTRHFQKDESIVCCFFCLKKKKEIWDCQINVIQCNG